MANDGRCVLQFDFESLLIFPQKGLNCNFGAQPYRVDNAVCAAMTPQFTMPVFVYRNLGGTSVIGGYVYRGNKDPRLSNGYVFADYQRCVQWQNNRYESFNCAGPNLMLLDEVLACVCVCVCVCEFRICF